jgi:restriction system-associated AAA family ATPase
MKLLRLQINNHFRSLPEGFRIVFREVDDNLDKNLDEPICLVGVNGSGKSNVLEALAEIFSYLDQTFLKYVNKHSDSPLINSFVIEYLLPIPYEIRLLANDLGINDDQEFIHIKILKERDIKPSFYYYLDGVQKKIDADFQSFMPKRIIGYSSGQNELLSIPFSKIKFRYYNTLLQEFSSTYRENVEYSRMKYIDYEENYNILLANFLMAKNDEANVLKETIFIDEIESFELIINRNKVKKEGLPIDTEIDKFLEFFESRSTYKYQKNSDVTVLVYSNIDKLKTDLQNNFGDAAGLYTLFKRLGYLNLNFVDKKSIDLLLASDIEIYNNYDIADFNPKDKLFQISEVNVKKNNLNYPINYKSLSDGEHQFIHVIGTLLMYKDESSLFLFDEPETHFNPQWKYEYTQTFKKITDRFKSQIVMTTHDPVLLSGLSKENVIVFNKPNSGKMRTYQPEKDLKGMGVDAILTSEIFGLNTTLDSETLNEMIELRSLLLKKEKIKLSEVEQLRYLELYELLKNIDFAQPLNDPMYRDFLVAKGDLSVYSKPILSEEENELKNEVAKKIMSTIKSKYS